MKKRLIKKKFKKDALNSMIRHGEKLFYCNDKILDYIKKNFPMPAAPINSELGGCLGGLYGFQLVKLSVGTMTKIIIGLNKKPKWLK